MKKQKLRMAFEELERELAIISQAELYKVKGGYDNNSGLTPQSSIEEFANYFRSLGYDLTLDSNNNYYFTREGTYLTEKIANAYYSSGGEWFWDHFSGDESGSYETSGYGNNGGVDGYCYFYTLEYLSSEFGGSSDINTYLNEYIDYYGAAASGVLTAAGVPINHVKQFTAYMFNTRVLFDDEQISANIFLGNQVMATLYNGTELHSIVITGTSYSSGIGEIYHYYDPMTNGTGVTNRSYLVDGHFIAVGANGSGTNFY